MAKFEKGNTLGVGKGHPKGVRNRLTLKVYQDVLDHWSEMVPGRNITKGMAALEVMYKTKPAEYVKVATAFVPRELILSDPTTADMSIEQIDALILKLRQDMLAPETEPTLN